MERTPIRRALHRALLLAIVSIVVAAVLVAGVDAGATMLGPVLIVVGAGSGAMALRSWWASRSERWFAAEFVLVAASWSLFGAALAGIQFLVFSFGPAAFFVDADYAEAAAPRYRAGWLEDSTQAAQAAQTSELAAVLIASGPPKLVVDSRYPLPNGDHLTLRQVCVDLAIDAACRRTLVLGHEGRQFEFALDERATGPADEVSRDLLVDEARTRAADQRRLELEAARKLADPARYVQPRIGDFLYETTIAFSGRDSGVFAPVGALARVFKVIESLGSYLLFGIVVARVAAAASPPEQRG